MPVLAQVFALVAAALHVVFFYAESVTFTRPTTWRRFGLSTQEQAEIVRPMAFNQGFYNLFLALVTAIGIVATAVGSATVGLTMVFVGTGSMVAAGLVLLLSSPSKAAAALKQLALPALAIVVLVIGVVL